jgi:hypothetical protein
VREQRPVVLTAPRSPAARALETLADRVLVRPGSLRPTGGTQFFFRNLVAAQV